MTDDRTVRPLPPFGPAAVVFLLGMAACLSFGFNLRLALHADDSANLESTLALVAARQLESGFDGLYGPYGGSNPHLLIQAPLYYRLTALVAQPLVRLAGLDPVTACLAAGRALSLACFLAILALSARLASGGAGSSRRAGVLAALLVAASPLLASFPVTVRADLMGATLQLAGLAAVARVLARPDDHPHAWCAGAFLAFAAAVATKQHLLAGPAAATLLLTREVVLRRIAFSTLAWGLAAGLVAGLAYAGVEQWQTAGQFWRSCVEIPTRLRQVTAGSAESVTLTLVTTLKRALPLIALAAAGFGLTLGRRNRTAAPTLAALLGLHVALESLILLKLTLDSSGAWFNYAIPGSISACVLIALGLDSALAIRPRLLPALPLVAASILLLLADVRLVQFGARLDRTTRDAWHDLEAETVFQSVAPQHRYFSGAIQHYNRMAGQPRLAHDEWLYHAFEAVGAAEPRAAWLARELSSGSTDLVIVAAEPGRPVPTHVPGVPDGLPELGFTSAGRTSHFGLWLRRPRVAPTLARYR
jgi:hypothetical protein